MHYSQAASADRNRGAINLSTRVARHRFTPWIAAAALLTLFAACDRPVSTPKPSGTYPSDKWHAMYMRGKKVGASHTTVEQIEEDGQMLIKQQNVSTLKVARFGSTTEQIFTVMTVETPEGQVVRMRTLHGSGGAENLTTAERLGNRLQITVNTAGKETTNSIPWSDNIRGFFGIERSLQNQPMKPGEKRKIKTFAPVFNQIVDVDLKAADYQLVDLLNGQSQKLLRVEATTFVGGASQSTPTEMKTVYWVDERGEPLRMRVPSLEQETFRVPEEIALQEAEDEFDIGEDSIVKLEITGRPLRERDSASYMVQVEGGDPAKIFQPAVYQQIRPLDNQTARISVRNTSPGEMTKEQAIETTLSPKDLAPNNLIQSDDELVKKMAASVLPGERNHWKLAKGLEAHVSRTVSSKNFSQAFASAADVARDKQGDCTEHAVLLAALCRARGIPARVVVGLVYVPELGGFGYHMWNEVAAGDHWFPLDATRPNRTFAGHLKLLDSNLAGENAYSSFMPVFQVMGRLKITLAE